MSGPLRLLIDLNGLALDIDWLTHVVAPRSWSEELALSMRARLRDIAKRVEHDPRDHLDLAANSEALRYGCLGVGRCADELLRVNTNAAIRKFAERAASRAYDVALVAQVWRSCALKRMERMERIS